jgi:hypothetical protein
MAKEWNWQKNPPHIPLLHLPAVGRKGDLREYDIYEDWRHFGYSFKGTSF